MFFQVTFHLFNLNLYATAIDGIVFPSQNSEFSFFVDFCYIVGCQFFRTDVGSMDDECSLLTQPNADLLERGIPIGCIGAIQLS